MKARPLNKKEKMKFSNANGPRGGCQCDDYVYSPDDPCYDICEDQFSNPYGPYEGYDVIMPDMSMPDCYDHQSAYEYLQNNSMSNTQQSISDYGTAIFTLLGGPHAFSPTMVGGAEGQYPTAEIFNNQNSCQSTFMDANCWLGSNNTLALYDPEQVANVLANALVAYKNKIFDIYNGVVVLPGINLSDYDQYEVFEGLMEMASRVLRLEQDCGPTRVPMIVEQVIGQIFEDLIEIFWNDGYGDFGDYQTAGYTLEQFMCENEFQFDSAFSVWETLNYTPVMCGGTQFQCPDCPDCGLSENCPDCDCPDPCPPGGGVTGGGGVVVTPGGTESQGFDPVTLKPNKPIKPVKPNRPIKPIRKRR